jgi:hypothetical protein
VLANLRLYGFTRVASESWVIRRIVGRRLIVVRTGASTVAGTKLKLRPLTVTVLDLGGHPIVVKREDGPGILRPQIAHAKAWGCLRTGHGGAASARHATRDPAFSRPWPPCRRAAWRPPVEAS